MPVSVSWAVDAFLWIAQEFPFNEKLADGNHLSIVLTTDQGDAPMRQSDEAGRHWGSAEPFHQDILDAVDSAIYVTITGGARTAVDSAPARWALKFAMKSLSECADGLTGGR
ncbi:hypothetical protein [Bradyrhizobium vignae]|uniref:Uncharacterized protein n=1 Tax=Bradyrhizobium vignae TaxID=1549949 RepID=A0A2U3PV53_9BRAD|nr:hypothetical protein [Bradyrhizobium vignae]SPP93030.1 protein of unknown function [Bradyrhizobium vignae]